MEKLTPAVIEKLVAIAANSDNSNTSEKPTKRKYMATLAKKSFNTFVGDFTLPKNSLDYLYETGQVDFYTITIMNYIKN